MSAIRFRVLGPLEVRIEGRIAGLGGTKQRVVLAALLLRANTVTSTEELIDQVWGDDPPENARAALHVYLSRLRRLLVPAGGEPPLVTHANGYMLEVAPGQLDVDIFERLTRDGREALARDAHRADTLLTQALELWRGSALADLAREPALAADINRLNEARVRAVEDRCDARLLLGRAEDAVPELQQLVQAYPYRERLRAQLMRSLWACGRQADALEAFQDARTTLSTDLGLEPGEELRQLQHAILTQDGSALPRPKGVTFPTDRATSARRRRSRYVLVVAAAVVAGVAVAAFASSQFRDVAEPRTAALLSLEPTSLRAIGSVDVPGATAMVLAREQAWLAEKQERIVARVDLRRRRVVERIGLPFRPDVLAAGDGVWAAAAGDAELGRFANAVVTRVSDATNTRPTVFYVPGSGGGAAVIAANAADLWVGNDDDNRVARVDTAKRRVSATVRTVTPRVLVAGRDVVWAVEALDDVVTRIDATSGRIVGSVGVELNAPSAGIEAAEALWVTDRASGLLWRINAAAQVATRTIEVGRGPIAIAYGGGFLWIANALDGTISKVDPTHNEVVATRGVDGHPIAVGWSDGVLWVLTRSSVS